MSDVKLNFDLNKIVLEAFAWKASDIHLMSGAYPSMRVHGDIRRMPEHEMIQPSDINDIAGFILNDKDIRKLDEHGSVDKSHNVNDDLRLRVNISKSLNMNKEPKGMKVVCRLVPNHIPTIEEFNMPDVFESIASQFRGLVIIGGVTGSGKSTTIAAMIEHINKNKDSHIVTIEDPIEFVHTPQRCIFTRREIGTHVESFPDGLRTALRQDPDVILVGEMRDLETMRAAMDAAETGHLVFATVHAGEVDDIPERIIQSFPEGEQNQIRIQIANVGLAFIAQSLIKKITGGRVAAYEILILNNAARNLIRENKSFHLASVMQTNRREGMITMEEYLLDLYRKKIISSENLIYYSSNKERAREYIMSEAKEIDASKPYNISPIDLDKLSPIISSQNAEY